MRHQRHTEQNEQCDIGPKGWRVAVERFRYGAVGGYAGALLRTRDEDTRHCCSVAEGELRKGKGMEV